MFFYQCGIVSIVLDAIKNNLCELVSFRDWKGLIVYIGKYLLFCVSNDKMYCQQIRNIDLGLVALVGLPLWIWDLISILGSEISEIRLVNFVKTTSF